MFIIIEERVVWQDGGVAGDLRENTDRASGRDAKLRVYCCSFCYVAIVRKPPGLYFRVVLGQFAGLDESYSYFIGSLQLNSRQMV